MIQPLAEYSKYPVLKPKLCIPGTICIEGNIGSGKTTLLAGLQRAGYIVFEEPVESLWGEHLPKLYSDPKRWGFTFQIEVVDWYKRLVGDLRKRRNENAGGGGNIELKIVERSPISTYEIFAKNHKSAGNLTEWEMKLLGKVVESLAWIPEHTFFIQTPYADAYQRLINRGREGEENVPLELLRQLELKHEAFAKSRYCGTVHLLDGRLGKEELVAEAIQKIEKIRTSISLGR